MLELDWENLKAPAGTKVRVDSGDLKTFLGIGTLLFDYDRNIEDDWTIPQIQMEDGSIIYGNECWWIPQEVAKEIEEKVKKKKLNEVL